MTEQEQLSNLKCFARDVIDARAEPQHLADLVQEFAIKYGLANKRVNFGPCGNDCICEYDLYWQDHKESFSDGIECGIQIADWLQPTPAEIDDIVKKGGGPV